MKIVDLEVADINYALDENYPDGIRDLKYHQKYLLLVIGNEVVSLEISGVSDTAFYLRIVDDGTLGGY